VLFACAHVYDVALCGNTVRNVALSLTCWPTLIYGVCEVHTSLTEQASSELIKFESNLKG